LPYIVTAMSNHGVADFLWVYITAVCSLGVIVYARMPETRGKTLD
jgi:MHS family alpha-ketoglutarate permease-like MFS transporter